MLKMKTLSRKLMSLTLLLGLTLGLNKVAETHEQNHVSTSMSSNSAAPGKATLSSSERNEVQSKLYEWWGLFEAADPSSVVDRFDALFTEDVLLDIGDTKIQGRDKLKSVFENLPARDLSHHEAQVDVTRNHNGDYQLQASFIYQVRPDTQAATNSGQTRYLHTLTRDSNGELVFSKLTGNIEQTLAERDFEASYTKNRVRAVVSRYLAITDVLDSDYAQLEEIMSDSIVVDGMIRTDDKRFNQRGDGQLQGLSEISAWLSSRADNFDRVAHQLGTVTVTKQAGSNVTAALNVHTQAWPKEAEKIDVVVPITMEFIDDGERFIKIERLTR